MKEGSKAAIKVGVTVKKVNRYSLAQVKAELNRLNALNDGDSIYRKHLDQRAKELENENSNTKIG